MFPLTTLLNLACGQSLPEESNTRSRRLQLAVTAMFLALLLAAAWGLAAGSSSWSLALSNTVKVPLVILLSSLAAIPAGMLTWRLSGARGSGSDLLLGFSSSVFAGTLVMAALSPVVALYYHSSTWAGPMLGMGSVVAALLVGLVLFSRRALMQKPAGVSRRATLLPVMVFVGMHLAALLQLIALAAPMLPELTAFDGGIDRIIAR
jgi:hypothetical protein